MADLQDVINKLTNEGALTRNKGANSTKSVKEILIRNQEEQSTFQSSLITQLADSVGSDGPGPSPAEQKEANEDSANADKKQSMFLKKIGSGIGWLVESGKKGLKAAKVGGLAFLSTLAIGGFLLALGKFLQSDTFKDITAYIFDTIIPKLKGFYNAFFGEGGGLFKGISTLFGDESGIGAVVIGLTAVAALFAVAKLAKIFGPLKAGVSALLSGIGGLAKRIPGIPKKTAAPSSAATRAGSKKPGKVGGALGALIGNNIGALLRGIAGGLAAIAAPPVLAGLAAVSVAILAISAAIRIMRPAFEPIGKMFESFGETIRTVFGGLGDFIKDIGSTIEGIIGSIADGIGNIIDKITKMKTSGTDATTAQIEKLSKIPGNLMLETAKGIDAIKAALDGFGGGTFSQITGSLFGGGGPIEKIIELSKKVPALMKAAEAIAVLGAAGSDFAKAEAEIERRKKVAELKKRIGDGGKYGRVKRNTGNTLAEDQAALSALEGQAMPMGGPSNISGQVAQMKYGPGLQKLITVAINESEITTLEKERMKREAEFKTASASTSTGPTIITDARQSSSVTTTGQSGDSSLVNNKFGNLNTANIGM